MQCATLLLNLVVPEVLYFVPETREHRYFSLLNGVGVVFGSEVDEMIDGPLVVVVDVDALFAHVNDVRHFVVADAESLFQFVVFTPVLGHSLKLTR